MNLQNKSFINNISHGTLMKLRSFFINPYRTVNLNWFKLKSLKHSGSIKPRVHKMLGSDFHFQNALQFMHGIDEIFIDNIYSIDLPPSPIILDCGANIGLSVLYFKKHHPDATIVAFEPDTTNFRLLEKNIASYNLQNVIALNQAVWIMDGKINFVEDHSMTSKISESKYTEDNKLVDCCRLKTHLTRKIDLLKIDIEGAEYQVFKDIYENLSQVNNLFLEYHGNFNQNNELCEIFNLINQAGMQFYIKEAAPIFPTPFNRTKGTHPYEVQLNIFCFR